MWEKTIKLTPDWAKEFNIVPDNINSENPLEIVIKSIKKDKNKVSIRFEFYKDKSKSKTKTISYKTKCLTPYQSVFIGWAFISLDNYKNSYKEKAKTYLQEALKANIDSCLPHYLLAYNDLEKYDDWEIRKLYEAMEKPDIFPDFYFLLWRKEPNKIRAEAIIKKGTEKFPHNLKLVLHCTEKLFNENKTTEALKILKYGQPFETENWTEYYNLIYLTSSIYATLKKYPDARRIIQNSTLPNDYKNFFTGLVYFQQKNYKKAVKLFTKAIEEEYENRDITKASLYYILNCYCRLKQTKDIKHIVDLLPKKGEWFVFPVHFHFAEFAEQTLKLVLKQKIEERLRSRISGFLASIILENKFWQEATNIRPNLTKKEKDSLNKSIALAEEAIRLHPYNSFFNLVLSYLLRIQGNFDKALYQSFYVLNELTEEHNLDYDHYLENCSQEFIDNYSEKIAKVYKEINFPIENYLDNYFGYDIHWLYERKKYQTLSNLYYWIKSIIDWKEFCKNIEKNKKEFGEYANNKLFEIAYSLNEINNQDEAKEVYEYLIKISGETSATLNNLSLIYENKNDLPKARKFIKKAKKLIGKEKDKIIDRNFIRLIKLKKQKNTTTNSKKEKEMKNEKFVPTFDINTGEIILGEKKCQIPLGSNQFQLCKTIFDVPLGDWVKEMDVIDNFYKGTDSQRSFYDAIRLVNKKVEKNTGIQKILEFKAASTRIRKEIFE